MGELEYPNTSMYQVEPTPHGPTGNPFIQTFPYILRLGLETDQSSASILRLPKMLPCHEPNQFAPPAPGAIFHDGGGKREGWEINTPAKGTWIQEKKKKNLKLFTRSISLGYVDPTHTQGLRVGTERGVFFINRLT